MVTDKIFANDPLECGQITGVSTSRNVQIEAVWKDLGVVHVGSLK